MHPVVRINDNAFRVGELFDQIQPHFRSQRRPVEVEDWRKGETIFRYTFAYDDKGNLNSLVRYNLWQLPAKQWQYIYSAHDTGVNYMRAVHGLPFTFHFDNNYHSYCSTCPNNFGADAHNWEIPVGQPYDPVLKSSYTYEYNDAGLPVKMRYSGWTVTMEYQKYR